MTRTWAFALLCAVGGCDPVWRLQVQVKAPTGQPLERAALILTGCPQQNEHGVGTVAVLTDPQGEARVGGLGTAYPACAITIAKPGYETQQTSFDQICNGNRDDCNRIQSKAVTLQPLP